MSNAYIITGLSDIVNPENIKPGIDIKELERSMVSGGLITKARDPQDRYDEELREQAKRLGISFGADDTIPDTSDATANTPQTHQASSSAFISGDDEWESETTADDADDDNDNYSSSYDNYSSPSGDSLQSRTQEQQRRGHIDTVMKEMGAEGVGFSFEEAKREDIKCELLAEIDDLITCLRNEDGVDLSRIPEVGPSSDLSLIQDVCKILRYKRDRIRYAGIFSECILVFATIIESAMDGKHTYFGRTPDMTDWSNVVQCKLRRMQTDTSTVVGDFVRDAGVGSIGRIMLELVPNAILYSRRKKQKSIEPGLNMQREARDAGERIRTASSK